MTVEIDATDVEKTLATGVELVDQLRGDGLHRRLEVDVVQLGDRERRNT